MQPSLPCAFLLSGVQRSEGMPLHLDTWCPWCLVFSPMSAWAHCEHSPLHASCTLLEDSGIQSPNHRKGEMSWTSWCEVSRVGVSDQVGAHSFGREMVRISFFKQKTLVVRVELKAGSLPLRNRDRLYWINQQGPVHAKPLLECPIPSHRTGGMSICTQQIAPS